MRRLCDEKIRLIRNARKTGIGFKAAAKQLSCSPATVHKYAKGINLSQGARKRLSQSQMKRNRQFALDYAKEKKIEVPVLCPDLANVLGHLFFDGSVCCTNGKYMLSYCNASIGLINEFISKTRTLFSLAPGKLAKFKGVNTDWYQVTFYSKKAFHFVKSFAPDFSTKKEAGVPAAIKEADECIKCSFLEAFWADEGCIDCQGRLTGSSKSRKMIEGLFRLHNALGISCKKRLSTNGRAHIIVVNKSLENHLKFYNLIGFGEAIVKAGRNLGRYKQDVLMGHLSKMASF